MCDHLTKLNNILKSRKVVLSINVLAARSNITIASNIVDLMLYTDMTESKKKSILGLYDKTNS